MPLGANARSLPSGGGSLAAGDKPNPLTQVPLFVLRACVYAMHPFDFMDSLRVSASYFLFFGIWFMLVFVSFIFVFFALFSCLCFPWIFVAVPLIVSCPVDHVPD